MHVMTAHAAHAVAELLVFLPAVAIVGFAVVRQLLAGRTPANRIQEHS